MKSLPSRPHIIRDEVSTIFDTIIDSMIDNNFKPNFPSLQRKSFSSGTYPKIDLLSLDDRLVLNAAVPGMRKEDIKIEVDQNNFMTISGRSNNKAESTDRYIYREIKRSYFSRSFELGSDLDVEKITAECQDGLLTISIPKVSKAPIDKIKSIEIK